LAPSPGRSAAAQHQDPPRGIKLQQRRAIRLLEEVVAAIVLDGVVADAVEADLRRLAPAAQHRQVAATVEDARRDELRLDALVAGDGVAAAEVDLVVGADVEGAAEAEREAAARVGAVEEWMPAQRPAFEHGVEAVEELLGLVRIVGMQRLGLLGLPLLDLGLA
jgi:hypothetical protein